MTRPLKIYLAGFDCFRKDAHARYAQMIEYAASLGLEAIIPSDGGLSKGSGLHDPVTAIRIFQENCAKIHDCEGILLNVNGFRGVEPDSGTAFEAGVAFALGKEGVGYRESSLLWKDTIAESFGDEDGYDAVHGMLIEDFGLKTNLMINCAYPIVEGDFKEAMHLLCSNLRR